MSWEETALRAREAFTRHEVLVSGSATGLAAGVTMMAVAMLGAAVEGLTLAHPARVLGESFVDPGALDGAAKLAYGLLLHVVVSVVMGISFAALVPRDFPLASAIGIGVGYTVLVFMFILMPLIVPWANPGFRDGMQGIGGTWIIGLSVFGTVLGTAPGLRRWAVEKAAPVVTPGTLAPPAAGAARSAARTS